MIVTLAIRVLSLIFAAVVLALSAVLIKDFGPGKGPALIGYGAFCGGAGLVIGAVGVIACFFDKLQGIIMLALDAFASFFLLAGGIVRPPFPFYLDHSLTKVTQAFAVTIKVGSCTDILYLNGHSNPFAPSQDKVFPGVGDNAEKYAKAILDDATYRCRMSQADTAIIWFLFGTFLAALVLSFVGRSGKRGGAIV
jgi:hypothetical protein